MRAFTECARMYEQCMRTIGHPVMAPDVDEEKEKNANWQRWKPRAEDFVADFSLACFAVAVHLSSIAEQVLHLRFVRLLPGEKVAVMTGLNGDGRDVLEEIYVQAGREMVNRGLWPVKKYFGTFARTTARR